MEIGRNATMLLCSNVEQSRKYLETALGLSPKTDLGWFVNFTSDDGDPPTFELSLCACEHESVPVSVRHPSDGVVLAFQVADADAEQARFVECGLPILAEVKTEPWGQRHFFAQAPDGVVLDIFALVPPDPEWMKAHGFA